MATSACRKLKLLVIKWVLWQLFKYESPFLESYTIYFIVKPEVDIL